MSYASRDIDNFRMRFREWLTPRLPFERRPEEAPEQHLGRWHKELYDGGFVGLSFPRRYGGQDLPPQFDGVVNEELGAAGAPNAPRIGYIAQAILSHGSESQRATYIPSVLKGDQMWCQGFSEPGAGSDLAAISTKATLTPDKTGYLVSGQKLWTSYAQFSDMCLLLARTGEPEDRHKGLTAFVLDLRVPNVDIRPLRALTGDDEFCELFLDGTFIPLGDRIGAEGDGWALAMTTVAYERGAVDIGYLSRFARVLDALGHRLAEADGPSTGAWQHKYWSVVADYEALRAHIVRRMEEREQGVYNGPGTSVDKLLMTRVDQNLHELALDASGSGVLLGEDHHALHDYLYSRAASVYGGTSQVQRNILAGSVLGLPRS